MFTDEAALREGSSRPSRKKDRLYQLAREKLSREVVVVTGGILVSPMRMVSRTQQKGKRDKTCARQGLTGK